MLGKYQAKRYCCEDLSKIENYEEAVNSPLKWACHHRLETHNSDGERRSVDLTGKELIALDMYYHRPADELIFLQNSEHIFLHKRNEVRSEEYRRKMSEKTRVYWARKHTEVAELPMSDIETGIKSDFESKVDAYFSKYYDLD